MMLVDRHLMRSARGVRFTKALLLAWWLTGAPGARGDDRPSVYVYVHTDTKSAALEKGLQDKLPSLAVTVFGRFRDFEEAMAAHRPDAVVALAPLLASLNVPVVLQGLRGDHDWEPYVLLSTGTAGEGSLSGKSIGVVDLLGRNGTQEFVAKLLKTPDLKLKRVTKMEDLLPLLQFSAADAVLVSAASVKNVTERSRLVVRVRELPDARVGLLAVGVLTPAVREIVVKIVQGLDAETNRALGVERWRSR
jgi:hypothetical protein